MPNLSWLDTLLPLALCFLGVFLVLTVLVYLNNSLKLETLEYQILATFAYQGTLIAILLLLRIKFPSLYGPPLNKRGARTAGQSSLDAFCTFIKCLPLVWLVAILSQQFFHFLGFNLDQQKPVEMLEKALDEEPIKFWALAFGAVVMAPVAEELLFRSYLYRFLKNKFTLFSATFLTALLFAAMHGNLASLMPLFLLGVLFARTYENTGNIVAPMVFHSAFNAFTILLLVLKPYFPDLQ